MRWLRRIIVSVLKRYREHLPLWFQRGYLQCATLRPSATPVKGRVLLSYALTSAGLPEGHKVFDYHSGMWESNTVASLFLRRGYVVDVIHYTNHSFRPTKKYDVMFVLTGDLYRLVAFAPNDASDIVKLWHMNTSSVLYQNPAERKRIDELEARRPGSLYFPRRQEPHEMIHKKVLALADRCVIVGSEHTLNTYPQEFRHKIDRIMISTSVLSYVKEKGEFVPLEREFLWFFGAGAVHKGLDLVLEVFALHPEWKLNVVGGAQTEPDFAKIYKKELFESPNITAHGYLKPSSPEFNTVARKCFALIAPSCSESISTATTTMMQLGLYPIVSRDTGIELPEGCGKYIDPCTVEEIERQVKEAHELSTEELVRQISATQERASTWYTREKYREGMNRFIERALAKKTDA